MGGRQVKGPGGDRLVVFETALFSLDDDLLQCGLWPAGQRPVTIQEIRAMVAMLEKVGLRVWAAKPAPPTFPGGMQRRGELARMLVNNPQVMILDEPFRGLDAMTRELMRDSAALIAGRATGYGILHHLRNQKPF